MKALALGLLPPLLHLAAGFLHFNREGGHAVAAGVAASVEARPPPTSLITATSRSTTAALGVRAQGAVAHRDQEPAGRVEHPPMGCVQLVPVDHCFGVGVGWHRAVHVSWTGDRPIVVQ